MLHTPARIGAGTPTGGQFAASSHPESAVLLEEPPTESDQAHPGRGLLVTDVMGDEYELTPGVIDDDADYVFRNGQCLALAVAVSRRTGWPIVMTCFDIPERLQISPEHHPDLVHATVRTPEGALLDIRGSNDPDVREMDGRHDVEWPADQVDALMAAYDVDMESQLVDIADTFVDSVLELREQELETLAQWNASAQPTTDAAFAPEKDTHR